MVVGFKIFQWSRWELNPGPLDYSADSPRKKANNTTLETDQISIPELVEQGNKLVGQDQFEITFLEFTNTILL